MEVYTLVSKPIKRLKVKNDQHNCSRDKVHEGDRPAPAPTARSRGAGRTTGLWFAEEYLQPGTAFQLRLFPQTNGGAGGGKDSDIVTVTQTSLSLLRKRSLRQNHPTECRDNTGRDDVYATGSHSDRELSTRTPGLTAHSKASNLTPLVTYALSKTFMLTFKESDKGLGQQGKHELCTVTGRLQLCASQTTGHATRNVDSQNTPTHARASQSSCY